jgi:hypothetical protein
VTEEVGKSRCLIAGKSYRAKDGVWIFRVIESYFSMSIAKAQDTNVLSSLRHDVVTNTKAGEVNFFDAYTHASTLSQC